MPRFSRWALRLALGYMLLGGTLGGLLLLSKALPLWPWLWTLRPAHIALMIVGWMLHLGFGVADWILPRRYGRHWRPWLPWAALGAANLGLLLLAGAGYTAHAALLRLLAYGLETLGAALMLLVCWPRVRAALPASLPLPPS